MMIKSLTPCDGWFYVSKGVQNEDIVFHVAAWALLDTDEVVGMIAASNARTKDKMARLVMPPPIEGTYLVLEQLSISQQKAARTL
jgi:hypothetical protein